MVKACIISLLILAACSGSTSSGGSSTLSGAGAFTPNYQMATFTDGGSFPNTAGVVIANVADINSAPTCAAILDGGSEVIGIGVGIGISADGGPLQVGDYTFVNPDGPAASGTATRTWRCSTTQVASTPSPAPHREHSI